MLGWGPWRPDQSGPNTGYAQVADNVIPQSAGAGPNGSQLIGYGPFPQLVESMSAGALAAVPRGSVSLTSDNGTYQVYFATSTAIYELQSDYTWLAIATGRSVTSGDDVSMVHFGDFLLNTDTTDGFQAYNVETPAGNNVVSGAPTARSIFICNDVVFALDCNGNNRGWQNSAIGDHTQWVLGGANGGLFPDGGACQCGVDLKNGNGLIFQTRAMRLVQFGAAVSPALFSIVKAADGRGSVGERSVISFDGRAYFLDTDGFYSFDLTNGVTPIGAEKVNRWFFDNVNSATLSTVEASIDPTRKIVCWAFFSLNNSSTTIRDRMIGYDWQLQEWFTCTLNTAALAQIATPGYVLDGMSAFGTLDQMQQIPLDDRFWQGGAPVFAAIDSTLKFATFSGTGAAATLMSYQTNSQFIALENAITPISDDASSTVSLGVARQLSDAVTWKTPVGRSRGGIVKLRGSGLNVTFQENHPAGATWTYANGIDYPGSQQGGPI